MSSSGKYCAYNFNFSLIHVFFCPCGSVSGFIFLNDNSDENLEFLFDVRKFLVALEDVFSSPIVLNSQDSNLSYHHAHLPALIAENPSKSNTDDYYPRSQPISSSSSPSDSPLSTVSSSSISPSRSPPSIKQATRSSSCSNRFPDVEPLRLQKDAILNFSPFGVESQAKTHTLIPAPIESIPFGAQTKPFEKDARLRLLRLREGEMYQQMSMDR